ncbi:hypothetical protein [Sphingobacterium sp. SYP-B4668]|uniref:hypothetical protein n=1 Tax=Sphingobacterium sp. SYP-B4668 TaxID=2996035 RepID=UPI0022DDD498|nr:hypothetical protein [Sphingobacterium sp. SYP-B4668]
MNKWISTSMLALNAVIHQVAGGAVTTTTRVTTDDAGYWNKNIPVATPIIVFQDQRNNQGNVPEHVKIAAAKKAGSQKIDHWITTVNSGKHLAVLENGTVIEMDTVGNWLRTAKKVRRKKLPAPVAAALDVYLGKGYRHERTLYIEDAKQESVFIATMHLKGRQSKIYIDRYGEVKDDVGE